MLPIKRIKKQVSGEVNELSVLSNEDIKMEVKVEEIDPLGNIYINTDGKEAVTHESDFESVYVKNEVQDEFDSEIIKQDRPQITPGRLKESLEMKLKAKTVQEKVQPPMSPDEREQLKLKNIALTVEMTALKKNNTRLCRSLQDAKKSIALWESREKLSAAKLSKANVANKRLQNKIDELQIQVKLLSENNSKLEEEMETLRGTSDGKRKNKGLEVDFNGSVEGSNGGTLTENKEPSFEALKGSIISLVKEKGLIEDQLDRKTAELKRTQEKYGNTIIALSTERRKTEELVKNMNDADSSSAVSLTKREIFELIRPFLNEHHSVAQSIIEKCVCQRLGYSHTLSEDVKIKISKLQSKMKGKWQKCHRSVDTFHRKHFNWLSGSFLLTDDIPLDNDNETEAYLGRPSTSYATSSDRTKRIRTEKIADEYATDRLAYASQRVSEVAEGRRSEASVSYRSSVGQVGERTLEPKEALAIFGENNLFKHQYDIVRSGCRMANSKAYYSYEVIEKAKQEGAETRPEVEL